MSFEEEFDSIIRRKMEEEKYPFDENNWVKTNAILDADRNITRALKIKQLYLPAAVILLIGSAGVIAFNYFNPAQAESTAKIAQVQNSNLSKEAPAEQTIQANPIIPNNTNNSLAIEENTTLTKVTSEQPEKISAPETPEYSAAKTNIPAGKEQPMVNNENAPEAAVPEAKNNVYGSASSQSEEKEPAQTQDISIGNTGLVPDNAQPLPPANSNDQQQVIQNSSVLENNAMADQAENTAMLTAMEETALKADYLSAVYSTVPFEVNESDLMSTPFVYLNRYDDEYYKKAAKTHYMNVEFGANYLLGWNAQHGKDGEGLNWFAGFNYGRYLSRKLSVSLGLQAYNIANIKQPFYLMAGKEYGFGSKNIYTRVSSNQLYYVAIPLKFNYAVNSTNGIGLGINAAYLVGADNTVSKYYLLDNEEKSIGSSEFHNKGVYKGISRMNLMLSAHYKTQFGKRIGLDLEFNYGLTDIFDNAGEIKNSEKPIGVRLGLTYTLFDK